MVIRPGSFSDNIINKLDQMRCIWSRADNNDSAQEEERVSARLETSLRKAKSYKDHHATRELVMKTIQSQGRIGGAILVLSLLLALGVALSATAQAQYPNDRNAQDRDHNGDQDRGRNWDRYGDYGGSPQLRQTALNAGYNEGAIEGRNARNQSDRNDYHDLSSYQNATMGYRSRFGDRELYQRYFREAFESGYNSEYRARGRRGDRNDNGDRNRRGRDWDGYGNFGGSAQLRQTALNAGYNEGIKQGQKDRNDRNDRNGNGYQDQSAYRKATKDYSSRLGDRELYRRYFREAYKTGYNDGTQPPIDRVARSLGFA